ncbi:MAG: RecQ family ATP-dependent DNA helicase [Prevotella sp.]|nr:RecQ family ATP-dependent DNA helicase [Prevotella sp.]
MDNGAPDNCQLSIVNYQSILKKYWGYDDFRGIQRDIIESIGAGNDTLGLMPTGGGKSITFQVPAMSMQGVCLVITPLIALMKDQVTHLRQRGIQAAAIYSGMSHDDILRTLENAILGSTKFLYVSPERLGSDLFVTKIRHMQVCFITVDEAHCISQWGYDFRPSYLQIARIRDVMPQVPVLALTATATPQVIDDICQRLAPPSSFHLPPSTFHVFRMSFERKNLAYVVRHADDKMAELVHILTMTQGTAIVYVRSRKRSKEISTELNDSGISATYYHAGLDTADKDQRQHAWQTGQHRVMVATNAFGMGIDKADVRVVVHYDCPDSVEAYFQEAGRAGRDGKKAYAVLLYNSHEHAKLEKRVADSYPEKDYIRQVYEHLAFYYQIATGDGYGVSREFSMEDFCRRFHHFPIRVHAALQILQRAGYIEYDEEQDNQARIHFLLERHDLYRLSQLTPKEDRVIETLLRNYGGLFADYEFVDESLLAQLSGMTAHELYQVLIGLSQRHILHFIPRKQVPYVRWIQRREDAEHIALPPSVYEDRREQYLLRINSMLQYAERDDRCRSRLLLEYFGETDTHDCQQCDICLQHKNDNQTDRASQQILQLLSDHQPHPLVELRRLPFDTQDIDEALALLISEERIKACDGTIKAV